MIQATRSFSLYPFRNKDNGDEQEYTRATRPVTTASSKCVKNARGSYAEVLRSESLDRLQSHMQYPPPTRNRSPCSDTTKRHRLKEIVGMKSNEKIPNFLAPSNHPRPSLQLNKYKTTSSETKQFCEQLILARTPVFYCRKPENEEENCAQPP